MCNGKDASVMPHDPKGDIVRFHSPKTLAENQKQKYADQIVEGISVNKLKDVIEYLARKN